MTLKIVQVVAPDGSPVAAPCAISGCQYTDARSLKDVDSRVVAKHIAEIERLKEWQRIANKRAIEVAELKKALERCLIRCEHLSHRKGEFHEWNADCPVEKMINAAMGAVEKGTT